VEAQATGETRILSVGAVFAEFPVALLISDTHAPAT
jgi:hypothetical protein